jgi:hypothetical protein
MARVLTAILAALFAFGSSVAVPVTRIERGRDSAAIVWIDREQAESRAAVERPGATRHAAPPPLAPVWCAVSHDPLHDLFQRPPPSRV